MRRFRDQKDYEEKTRWLAKLGELNRDGLIDLYYGDESGFNLVPSVSYAWQPQGQTIEVPSRKSGRLNVFGIYSRDNDFHYDSTTGSINSVFIINSIDKFASQISKPTALIIDNAPTHTSYLFIEMIKEWEKKGLYIVYLPKYSPHLNLIETLWRKVKYEWVPIKAYSSETTLHKSLHQIFRKIGSDFSINFKEL